MKISRLTRLLLSVCLILAMTVAPAFAGTAGFWTTPGGGGAGSGGGVSEVAPRGFGVQVDGQLSWMSSHYDNIGWNPIYMGADETTGTTYIPVKNADGSAPEFSIYIDRNPGVPLVRVWENGAVETSFTVASPIRDAALDPSGQTGRWRNMLNGLELQPGSKYEFAFLRGIRANNGVYGVFSESTMTPGYVQNPTLPEELANIDAHKNDEFMFREYPMTYNVFGEVPNYDMALCVPNPVYADRTTPPVQVGDFIYREMRYSVQTYADTAPLAASLQAAETARAAITQSGGTYDTAAVEELDRIIADNKTLDMDALKLELQTVVQQSVAALDAAVAAATIPLVDPIAGASAFDTAAQVALEVYPAAYGGSDTVILATGFHWADALGGSALAGVLGAPILLVDGVGSVDALPASVQEALTDLSPSKVIILGGRYAVSEALETSLQGVYGEGNVERIAGNTQYDTADAVAARVIAEQRETWDGTAIIATGAHWADALAISPIAVAQNWPVFLVDPSKAGQLTPGATAEVDGITRAIVVGGNFAVPAAVEAKFTADADGSVERIAGSSQYDTAAAIATFGVEDLGMTWNRVALATGQAPFDALVGGVLQAQRGSVLLLTDSKVLTLATAQVLTDNKASISSITYFGGIVAITPSVRDAVEVCLGR